MAAGFRDELTSFDWTKTKCPSNRRNDSAAGSGRWPVRPRIPEAVYAFCAAWAAAPPRSRSCRGEVLWELRRAAVPLPPRPSAPPASPPAPHKGSPSPAASSGPGVPQQRCGGREPLCACAGCSAFLALSGAQPPEAAGPRGRYHGNGASRRASVRARAQRWECPLRSPSPPCPLLPLPSGAWWLRPAGMGWCQGRAKYLAMPCSVLCAVYVVCTNGCTEQAGAALRGFPWVGAGVVAGSSPGARSRAVQGNAFILSSCCSSPVIRQPSIPS